MRAIILAAGKGSRLNSKFPKCLQKVGEERILQRLIRQLSEAGIIDISVVTGFKHHILERWVRQYIPIPIDFVYNPDWNTSNNGVSLFLALAKYGPTGEYLVTNGDNVFGNGILTVFRYYTAPNAILAQGGPADSEAMKIYDTGNSFKHFSKGILPGVCEGEFCGVFKIFNNTTFWGHLVQGILNDLNVWFDLALSGYRWYKCSIPPGNYVEVDTYEDLESAIEMLK